MMHFGMNGTVYCGASNLLAPKTTTDLQAVDCLPCLWKVLGENVAGTDRIALRIKLVTDEKIAASSLVMGASRARG